MISRFLFDALSALLLFLVAALGAWLPRRLAQANTNGPNNRDSTSSKLYHLGNCLSGGVMLSAGFCHLLADSLPTLGFVNGFPMVGFGRCTPPRCLCETHAWTCSKRKTASLLLLCRPTSLRHWACC